MEVFEHILDQQVDLGEDQKGPLRLALSEVLDALRSSR